MSPDSLSSCSGVRSAGTNESAQIDSVAKRSTSLRIIRAVSASMACERALAEVVVGVEHLEEVELDVAEVALVVAHGAVLSVAGASSGGGRGAPPAPSEGAAHRTSIWSVRYRLECTLHIGTYRSNSSVRRTSRGERRQPWPGTAWGWRPVRRILDATREVLAEDGLNDLTLKAITDRAGVGAGSFYNLFDTKEAAILEVVREAIEAVDPDPAGLGKERVEDLTDAFVSFFVDPRTSLAARIYLQLALAGALTDEPWRRGWTATTGPASTASPLPSRASTRRSSEAASTLAERLLAALMGACLTWVVDPELRRCDGPRRRPAGRCAPAAAERACA